MLLANTIGPWIYQKIADFYPDSSSLVGEWLFSNALYERPADNRNPYAFLDFAPDTASQSTNLERFLRELPLVVFAVDDFLDACVADILSQTLHQLLLR